jgi:predicted metal-dependent phosphoesterase TrpH
LKRFGAERHLKLKLDLHVHTNRSSDGHTRIDDLVPNIRRAGLDGLAITDHNILSTDTFEDALIIPGSEISSRDGHIIGLGLSSPVLRGLSGDETIKEIRKLGGVSIVVHPYDLFRSAIKPDILTTMPDAVEVVNSGSIFHSMTWKRARAFALEHRLPMTAGSDSHIPETIGNAFTTIESDYPTIGSVLDAIKKGATTAQGRPNTLGERLRKRARRR